MNHDLDIAMKGFLESNFGKIMNSIKSIRKDWNLIESLINEKSRILDVGCGEGELIQQLEKNLSKQMFMVVEKRPRYGN